MNMPFLIGERLYLRPLSIQDAEGNYPAWLNDEYICRYSEHHVTPYTREMAREYIQNLALSSDRIFLAIIDKQSDTHIGNIALSAISNLHRSAEFSLMIGEREFHSRGLAKEASLLMLQHGFASMNLHRIFCGTMHSNLPMQKLALSLGMQEEGRVRDEVYKDGKYHDTYRYSILKDEFFETFSHLQQGL